MPPNVQAWTTKPVATVMSFSMIGMSTSWTVPGRTAGAVASWTTYAGALGSATGAPAAAAAGAAEAVDPVAQAFVALPMPAMASAEAAGAAVAAGADAAGAPDATAAAGAAAKLQAGAVDEVQPAVVRTSTAAPARRRERSMIVPFPSGSGAYPDRSHVTPPRRCNPGRAAVS